VRTGRWILDAGCKRIKNQESEIKNRVSSSEQGFTIIESILAVVILGLMAMIAIPRLVSTDMRVASIAYHQITADMRYARSLATANAEDYKVRFNQHPSDSSYVSYSIVKASDNSEVKAMDISERATCAISVAVGGGIDNPWEITFTRLGNADPDKSGVDIITLTVGEYVRTISVVAATGKVS
jgi:prepilin-type N-terminal cleavage/methylation domain-containing protein